MGPKRAPIAQRLMARPLSSGRIRSATVPLGSTLASDIADDRDYIIHTYPPIVTGATPCIGKVSDMLAFSRTEVEFRRDMVSRTYPAASKESKNNEHVHIRRESTSDGED